MCCVCAGSCNHVGNHAFCEAHGWTPAYGRVTTTTGTTWGATRSLLTDEDVDRIARRVVELMDGTRRD